MAAEVAAEVKAAVAADLNAAVAAALDTAFVRQRDAIRDAVIAMDRARASSATTPTSSSSDMHAPTVALACTSSSVQAALAAPSTYSTVFPEGDTSTTSTPSSQALVPTSSASTNITIYVPSSALIANSDSGCSDIDIVPVPEVLDGISGTTSADPNNDTPQDDQGLLSTVVIQLTVNNSSALTLKQVVAQPQGMLDMFRILPRISLSPIFEKPATVHELFCSSVEVDTITKCMMPLAELQPWPSWELSILVVRCHYARVYFQWKNAVRKYISSTGFLAFLNGRVEVQRHYSCTRVLTDNVSKGWISCHILRGNNQFPELMQWSLSHALLQSVFEFHTAGYFLFFCCALVQWEIHWTISLVSRKSSFQYCIVGCESLYGCQNFQAMVAWGTSWNQLHSKYHGLCYDLGCASATTHLISLLPWDPGVKTEVSRDSILSRDSVCSACVKKLDADLSGSHDHHQKFGYAKTQTYFHWPIQMVLPYGSVSRSWDIAWLLVLSAYTHSLAIERKPWLPPLSTHGSAPAREKNAWFHSWFKLLLLENGCSLKAFFGCRTIRPCFMSKLTGLTPGGDTVCVQQAQFSCQCSELHQPWPPPSRPLFSSSLLQSQMKHDMHVELVKLWDPGIARWITHHIPRGNTQYSEMMPRSINDPLSQSRFWSCPMGHILFFHGALVQWKNYRTISLVSLQFLFYYCSTGCESLHCPRKFLLVQQHCPPICQEKWYRFLAVGSSGAGSVCVCSGIVTRTFWPHFKLDLLPPMQFWDLNFWRYPSVDQMMLKTGHVFQCGLELIQWRIAWSLNGEYFGVVNQSKQLIYAATLTYLVFYSPWDPGIWVLLCFFGFFTPAGEKGGRDAAALVYYCGYCLDHAFYFDKVCADHNYYFVQVCIDYGTRCNLVEVVKLKVPSDPGGSTRHRLEVKPKFKEGGMLATSPYFHLGHVLLGLGCFRSHGMHRLQILEKGIRTSWLGLGWLRPPCFCSFFLLHHLRSKGRNTNEHQQTCVCTLCGALPKT